MESFIHSYAKQLYKHFDMYAHWTPYNKISLGDIGILNRGVLFERKDTLMNLFGVEVTERKSDADHSNKNHWSFSTSGQTEVNFIASGTAGLVHSGINISFKKENSFFCNLSGIQVFEIENQLTLAQKVMDLYWTNRWDPDWVVITECIEAENSTILGSMSRDNSIKLEAKQNLPVIDLADVTLDFNVKSAHSLDLNVLAQHKLRPLLKVGKIRRKNIFSSEYFGFNSEDELTMDELKEKVKRKNGNPDDFFEFALSD